MPQIKIDKADQAFSLYIRERDDWTCQRCGSIFDPWGEKTGGLHNSHYFGRGREGTRFDPENCDALCYGCHRYWEKADREEYRAFKVRQLGENRFLSLTVRANTYKKKDRKLARIIWTAAYHDLCKKKKVTPKL